MEASRPSGTAETIAPVIGGSSVQRRRREKSADRQQAHKWDVTHGHLRNVVAKRERRKEGVEV